jgi:hypothetical protein
LENLSTRRGYLECGTPDRIHKLYARQRSAPGYQQLLNSNITIFGTLDDHDFGCNNADCTFTHKRASALAFNPFLDLPEANNHALQQRVVVGHGVYGVQVWDLARPVGQQLVPEDKACIDPDVVQPKPRGERDFPSPPAFSKQSVAVFVLDVRTHKTPWLKGWAAYAADDEGDFLGERQWVWLEEALHNSRASVNVVVNGLQGMGYCFPNGNVAEAWTPYPTALSRLQNALFQPNVQAPLLISGDVHMTQLMRQTCTPLYKEGIATPAATPPHHLVELTTSGMTHSWGTLANPTRSGVSHESGRHSSHCWYRFLKSLGARLLMYGLHAVAPWTEIMHARGDPFVLTDGMSSSGLQYSLSQNFGEIEFDWEVHSLTLRSLGQKEEPLLGARFGLDKLSGRTAWPPSNQTRAAWLIDNDEVLTRHGHGPSNWHCVNHRATDYCATSGFALSFLLSLPLLLPCGWLCMFCIRKLSVRISRKC